MTSLRREAWSSLRLLASAPRYTFATVITLALAIGANAIFSLVNGVLLKPVPIHDSSRLVVCWGTDQAHHLPVVELTYRTVEMFSRQSRGFSQIAAMGSTTWPAWLRDRGAIQRISTAGVTAGFVETLGVAPVLGRTIRPEDDTAKAPLVVLLSYVRLDLYEAASQAATDATTIVVRTSGDPLRAASVLQAEVRRLDPHATIDGTTTMESAVGRVMAPWRFSAWTFGAFAVFAFGLACIGLFGVVSLDVGNRRHELAVRLAVGARRVDLLRCVFVPAAWKLLIGAALGAFAALVSVRAISSLLFGVASTDPATYIAVIVLVCVVVTVASYVPARHAARINPAELLIRH